MIKVYFLQSQRGEEILGFIRVFNKLLIKATALESSFAAWKSSIRQLYSQRHWDCIIARYCLFLRKELESAELLQLPLHSHWSCDFSASLKNTIRMCLARYWWRFRFFQFIRFIWRRVLKEVDAKANCKPQQFQLSSLTGLFDYLDLA